MRIHLTQKGAYTDLYGVVQCCEALTVRRVGVHTTL
jgi:hypothetical protein